MRRASLTVRSLCASLFAATALAFSAAPTLAASEIVIGQVVPLTGVIAGTGDEYSSGAAAYFASVNAKGGVYGRKIRVVQKDDAYKPEATLAHTKEILEKDTRSPSSATWAPPTSWR